MSYIESMLLHDEAIIYTGRKHFTMVLGQVLTEVILLGLTGVAMWLVGKVLVLYEQTDNALVVYVMYGVLVVAALVLLVSAILDYMRWYNDCVVLTNQRIMKFEGLFNRHMVESSLDKINDVALNQTIFGRLIGYGDITILTAAETGIQEMRNIADPVSFKRALAEARNYDAMMMSRATVAAVEDAVETAVENAVSDQQDDHTHDDGDSHSQHDHFAHNRPTPPANDRPTDAFMHAMHSTTPTDDVVAPVHAADDADAVDAPNAFDASADADTAQPTDEFADSDTAVPSTHMTHRVAVLLSYLEALHAAGVLSEAEFDTKRRFLVDDRA